MRTNLFIFLILTVLFLGYSLLIYLRPLDDRPGTSSEAGSGKMVWQKYNCQACHQLYGLGGYLGPDLTNVISEKGKGEHYVIGMVRSGSKQMPAFTMTETEEQQLIGFLRHVNASGVADPRTFAIRFSGMIEKK